MTPKLLHCNSIVSTMVRNSSGEEIGEIKDLMIDWKTGSVAYAVLSFGGFLGIDEKLFAIPLQAFEFDLEGSTCNIRLDIDRDSLNSAPGFDKDNWPQDADHPFIESVYSHYGYGSYKPGPKDK